MTDWTTTEASGLLLPLESEPAETAVPEPIESSAQNPAQRSIEEQPLEIIARPWRRFWARMLDLLLDGALIGITVGALRPSLLEEHGLLWQLLLVPSALLIDCLVYTVFGTTPGKAVAGIQVIDDRGGGRLTFGAYFKRSVEIYIFGFGLGLPLVSLVTLFRCYRKLADGETLSWDQYAESKVTARSTSWVRTSIVALIYLALIAGVGVLERRAQLERAVREERAREVQRRNLAEQELQSMARDINKMGPMFVRPNNRFDSAHGGPGLMFTYGYTMTALRKSQLSARDLDQFRQAEQDRLFQAACRGHLIYMFDTAETLRAHYSDRDGAELATAEVRRADCGRTE
jgi:uncharacterized RDD family membrane protein YckC